MLGKVHGPYTRPDGIQFVIVIHHNENGSIKARKTLTYSKYLKEYDEGLHRYEKVQRPININKERSRPKATKEHINKLKESGCGFCGKPVDPVRTVGIPEKLFCSKKCREKYRRRKFKRMKVTFKKQYIVTINKKQKNQYLIIVDICLNTSITVLVTEKVISAIIVLDRKTG